MATYPTRQGMREVNCEQVLRTILREGPLARVELAQRIGLTTAAITNITRELIDNGLLCEVGTVRGSRVGTNAILLDLPEETPILGVVHQGVSALRIALCNLRGRVIARQHIATPERYTPSWAATTIAQALRELLRSKEYAEEALVGIGAGLVGLVDVESGLIKRAPNLGWENVPLGNLLAEQLKRPVVIENNVRAMAFGEALLGNGKTWSDFAYVYIGTGIGSGLIIGGRPYRGAHGGAGEIGHITVDPAGKTCTCGNRGCLETIAAEPVILGSAALHGIELSAASGGTKEAIRELAMRARANEEGARTVIADCGQSLGLALANLVDIFNPGHIVLHGAITEAGDVFFSPVERCLQQHAFLTRDESITLASPTFGNDAGLVGAAAIALDALILSGGGMRELARAGAA